MSDSSSLRYRADVVRLRHYVGEMLQIVFSDNTKFKVYAKTGDLNKIIDLIVDHAGKEILIETAK